MDVTVETGASTDETRPPEIWVVRADGGRYTDNFVANGATGYVGVGDVDVSSAGDRQEVRRRYEQAHPAGSVARTNNWVGQLSAFRFEIREGDYVITPEADRGRLRYGRVIGRVFFAAGDDGCPYRNRRAVDWAAGSLERNRFSDSFQNTLGSLKAVFRVSHRKEFLEAIGRDVPPDRGVEEEPEDPESAVYRPFDPSKIRVHTVPTVVGLLVSRIENDEIDLAPDFQRMSGIWNVEKKSRLIESLLLRIPIPVFYVAADPEDRWAVVDGVQRLSTIRDYVTGKFPLNRLEYRTELDGCRHDDLPRAVQRRIAETQFIVNVIEPGTPPAVTFNIFKRINTGGTPLNGQEIRHAMNPGPVRGYLKRLAESDEFAQATDGSISTRRMDDRACVLRFLAFHMEPWEQYAGGSLDGHLDAAMKSINQAGSDRRDAFADDFRKAMRAAAGVFGNDAFRKRYSPNDSRYQISMPLFEAWSVQLARCSRDQLDRLVDRREEVRSRFMALLNEDQEFEQAISSSTGTPRRIRKRFAAVRDLVRELVRC